MRPSGHPTHLQASEQRRERQADLQRREAERQHELSAARARAAEARALDNKLDAAEKLQDVMEQQEPRDHMRLQPLTCGCSLHRVRLQLP